MLKPYYYNYESYDNENHLYRSHTIIITQKRVSTTMFRHDLASLYMPGFSTHPIQF